MNKDRYSTLEYVLLALIPYSRPNMLLTFKPHKFFNELEMLSNAKRSSLQSTLSRASQQGLVRRKNGVPVLTPKGLERIKPYTAKTLQKNVQLMVAFDIPEYEAFKRRQFRAFLRQSRFRQAQKSIWVTDYDLRKELKATVSRLGIQAYVDVYECAKITI